jgi:hypothetical protein
MSKNETSEQERTDLEVTVCSNGVVNVHRPESDRAHSVIVVGGDVVRCSCKGHRFRGECTHQDAIEARPLVVSSASAASTTRVATDGGTKDDEKAGRGLRTVTRWEPGNYQTTDDEQVDETPL